MLSEEMRRFGKIAHMKRIDYIKAKLIKETSLGVLATNSNNTYEEENLQKAESSLTKSQVLSMNGYVFDAYQVNPATTW